MRRNEFAFAALGWVILIVWCVALVAGGRKHVVDYAQRLILDPLEPGKVLGFSDKTLAVWSGWWTPDAGGFRLSMSANPDILFRSSRMEQNCDVTIAAFPVLATDEKQQRLYAALNGSELRGPIMVAEDGRFRVANIGGVKVGINVLTFHLPDARQSNPMDERPLALGLRSIDLSCRN